MHFKKVHTCFFIFLAIIVNGQNSGCPKVNITDNDHNSDISLNCNSQTGCITLVANYPETGTPTHYEVESIEYNPIYPFSGLAYPISVNIDDVWSDPKVELPFDFCFYNQEYSSAVVSSNGAISFDLSNINDNGINTSGDSAEPADHCPWEFNLPIPNPEFPRTNEPKKILNAIFGVFHDIDPSEGGEIGWEVFGEFPCRTLVVSYYEVPLFQCTDVRSTFQMVLYESTNIIEVNIQKKSPCDTWNNGNSLIGIQNYNGTLGISAPDRNTENWVSENESWQFIPKGENNTQVNWYDTTNGSTYVGSGNNIEICPLIGNSYTVEVIYQLCNGSTIEAYDSITISSSNFIISNDILEYNTCDEDENPDGLVTLDLNQFNNELITELNSLNTTQINYFLNESDAIDYNLPINPNTSFTTSSNPGLIYGRIDDPESNCVLIKPILITVNLGPSNFNTDVSSPFSNNHQILITVNGNGTYIFSLNDSDFQENNLFNNLIPGVYTLTLKDVEGCFFEILEIAIIDYPRFFSPNGDGINDTWNVVPIDELNFIDISIFDRYNKFIAKIDVSNKRQGWNGLYNKEELPSDDYWFRIIYEEKSNIGIKKEFIGHFSLKR